jgi:hypothetical protein
LILEESKMRKVFCALLGLQLIVSGCAWQHCTAHCEGVSDEIAKPSDTRENYYPILTPVTDVAAECYCYGEDAAIAILILACMGLVRLPASLDVAHLAF